MTAMKPRANETATPRPANWPNSARSLLDGLNACAAQGLLNDALEGLSARELARLLDEWEFVARRDQWPPHLAASGAPWRTWLILGGRGAGKTRAGAEWVKAPALGRAQFSPRPLGRIALVGETAADVREVMVEGVSGLLAVHGSRERPRWETTRKVARKQASSIIINLRDSSISTAEVEAQFRRYQIDGLNRLWVIDRDGKLFYLKGGW